jgi:membrane protein
VAQAFVEALTHVHVTGSGWKATVIGIALVLFASTGLFTQLQLTLNVIWGVKPKPGRSFWNVLRGRFFAFVVVVGTGALLVLSLIANTALLALNSYLGSTNWSGEYYMWEGMDWVLTLMLQTLLFALIYKLLPDAIITWRDVAIGAFITALLFGLGNFLICQYLYRAAPASVYGPAGSLVVIMLWVYYSSQILLFGAEFTKNFANKYGKPMQPAKYAVALDASRRAQ